MTLKNPIKGKITPMYQPRGVQVSEEEFEALIQAHFAENPTVQKFEITAYTPYFNDGEPCVYRAWLTEEHYRDDDYPEGEGPVDVYTWADGTVIRINGYDDPNYPSWERQKSAVKSEDLSAATWSYGPDFGGKGIEDVCATNFGDHAKITVYRDKYVVDFYEHG